MLSLLKTAALCSLAAVAAAQPTGLLYGLFTDGDGICQLMSISPTTGENVTIGPVDICNQVSQRFPAQSTWNSVTKELVVAIQAGPSVFSVDINTAKTTVLAPLPEYNSTDRLLGIRELAGKIYMVTQYHVYVVANGKLNDLNVPLAAPEYAQVRLSQADAELGRRAFTKSRDAEVVSVPLGCSLGLTCRAMKNVIMTCPTPRPRTMYSRGRRTRILFPSTGLMSISASHEHEAIITSLTSSHRHV